MMGGDHIAPKAGIKFSNQFFHQGFVCLYMTTKLVQASCGTRRAARLPELGQGSGGAARGMRVGMINRLINLILVFTL